MKYLATSLAALTLAAAPLAASAEVEFGYGFQANAVFPETSDTYYTGEGYVEAYTGPFTFGVWVGSLPSGTDDAEFDIYAGYGYEFANGMTLDTTVTAYVYDSTGYDDTDINVELGVPVSDAFSLAFGATYLIDAEDWDVYADAIYSMDAFTVTAEVGDDGATYWSLAGTYAFTDNVWAEVEYADADASEYEITVSVGYDF